MILMKWRRNMISDNKILIKLQQIFKSNKCDISTIKSNEIALSIMTIKKCKHSSVRKHLHMKHIKNDR